MGSTKPAWCGWYNTEQWGALFEKWEFKTLLRSSLTSPSTQQPTEEYSGVFLLYLYCFLEKYLYYFLENYCSSPLGLFLTFAKLKTQWSDSSPTSSEWCNEWTVKMLGREMCVPGLFSCLWKEEKRQETEFQPWTATLWCSTQSRVILGLSLMAFWAVHITQTMLAWSSMTSKIWIIKSEKIFPLQTLHSVIPSASSPCYCFLCSFSQLICRWADCSLRSYTTPQNKHGSFYANL